MATVVAVFGLRAVVVVDADTGLGRGLLGGPAVLISATEDRYMVVLPT